MAERIILPSDMTVSDEETPARGRCPICGAPTEADIRPFCSRRCADVDLSRWLRGAYAIPAQSADDDEDGDDPGSAASTLGYGAGQSGSDEL